MKIINKEKPSRQTQPARSDFSQKAIKNAVMKDGLTHWLTIYPPAVGIPFGLAAFLFNLPWLYLVMIGSLSVGLGSAIINIFFREETIARRYLDRINREIREREERILETLQEDLKNCLAIPGAEQYARQAVFQYDKLGEKYQNVFQFLDKKLERGELTFGRFLGVAEQVYLSGLDNLRRIAGLLQSVGSVDVRYIDERLDYLATLQQPEDADLREQKTMEKRLALRREQLSQINSLLTQNEEAMTQLEETTAAIASMTTDGTLAKTDVDTAINQLHELAKRAHIYNT